MFHRIGKLVFLLGFLSTILFACTPQATTPSESISSPGLETVTLQLKWFHQFQFAGYYAAIEQGYYREAGLDVQLVEGNPSTILNTYDEVISGRAQYGVSNTETLIQRASGKPIVVLAAIFQHSPLALMTRRADGIKTPHDLIGRRVLMPLETRSAELQAMFIQEGIPLESIDTLGPSHNQPDVLFDDTIDAFSVYKTNEPFYWQEQGIPISFIQPQTYGIDFYGDVLFTSEAEISNHPERVERFREASLRGWDYAMAHPNEIITLIIDRYNSSKPHEHLEFEAEQMRPLILPELVELGTMNPGRWRHIADTYAQLGMMEPDYSLDGFLYEPSVIPDHIWIVRLLGGAGILLLIMALGAAGLLVFNRQLSHLVNERTLQLKNQNMNLMREIDERTRAEAGLRQSEARFRTVWDTSSDAMALSDAQGVVLIANQAYFDLYGYSSEQIVGQNFAVIFPPEQRDWANEQYQLIFNSPEAPPAFESQIAQADGQTRTVESRIGFIMDGEERVAMLSSIRDVTARVMAETNLRQSQESNRAILDAIPDLMFRLSREGEIVDFRARDTEDLVLSPEKVIGSNIKHTMPAEVAEVIVSNVNRVLATGQISEFEFQLDVRGGHRDFEARLVPVGDDNALAIVRNITQQQQLQRTLVQNEETLRRTFEAILDPTLLWERHPDGSITLARYNKAAETMSQGNIAGFLNQPAELFFEQSPETTARIRDTFETGQAQRIEIEYQMRTIPETKWLVADYVKTSDRYLLNIVRDVTEIKQFERDKAEIETRLRKTQRLETIGTLAGGIAHDFNNLLTPIIGFAELAAHYLPKDHLVENYLKQIGNAGNRAKELVEQILVFSREVNVERTPTKLGPVIESVLQLLQISMPPNIKITKRLDSACESVLVNPGQIHQAIMNLCTNAVQAMSPDGGQLTLDLTQLTTAQIQALAQPELAEKPHIKLTVADTGPGIDPVTIDRIFEPFFTTKPVGQGTGLGLSVVHGIINSNQGAIFVDSKPGHGTMFEIYLPTFDQDTVSQPEKHITPQGQGEHILLVDDEAAIIEFLTQALSDLGYVVTSASSSEHALELLHQNANTFDLVITDLSLPGKNGIELARETRLVKSTLPIILITGHLDSNFGEKLAPTTVNSIIHKPVSLANLDQAIRDVLD